MQGAGGVAGPASVNANLPAGQGGSADSVNGQHSQFGNVLISQGPASAAFLEEASISLSSLRKFESKDQKKEKDLQKELQRLKETVPDLPGMEKMDKFLQQLQQAKSSNQTLTDDQIREFSQEYSGDATHQYLGIEALIEHLQAQGEDEQANRLKDYNSRFYEDNKKDIQAGINVSAVAADFVDETGFGSVQELRDTWRTALEVPDFVGPLEAYNYAKDKFGYEDIDKGVKWLMEALATEMHAMTSSVAPEHLTHVRKRLEVTFGLQTTIEASRDNENVTIRMLGAANG
ncbi:hypothetical protein M3P05_11570 [Sansalvadorimonas sp. 2012CJ34-2]|uniref:Hypersensitivity response secretion-like HrpJ domain-containing protein n=1 Tax=Parendozoicomonas callyspongiae TaxID=2942213 RepID=A0ABT0PIH7_9GAMM|nr:HrpJ domain-containing protein [Sansalvadorimonas sp. 2012CJ34-2]MCL6270562.1 hypothetical protein [Sansalvadorimonas sp. 2012CJ34-2]